jgi:hypothetical protein
MYVYMYIYITYVTDLVRTEHQYDPQHSGHHYDLQYSRYFGYLDDDDDDDDDDKDDGDDDEEMNDL